MIHPTLRYISAFTLGLALVMGLSSCGAKRQQVLHEQVTPTIQPNISQGELLERTLRASDGWQALRGTISGTITTSWGRELSSKMSVQAVRGKGLRLSVVPFPMVELARVWFTTEGVTLVDVMNGRYAQEPYERLSEALGFKVDYPQLEALLLGQVFAPGEGSSLEALSRLSYSVGLDDGLHYLSGSVQGHRFEFGLGADGLLRRLLLLDKAGQASFRGIYSGGQPLGQGAIPSQAHLSILGANERPKVSLGLEWTKVVAVDDPASLSVEPSLRSSYERITLDQLLDLFR